MPFFALSALRSLAVAPAMPTFLALIGQKIAASILYKTGIHNVFLAAVKCKIKFGESRFLIQLTDNLHVIFQQRQAG